MPQRPLNTGSQLRTDILSKELKTPQQTVQIIAETQFVNIELNAIKQENRTKTPEPAKDITEVMVLIKNAIEDYETRTHSLQTNQITVIYDEPDSEEVLESISLKLIRREPGMFSQGSPFENKTRQLKPLLRETLPDLENPGYRRLVLGQFYDNILQLTCWSRTNKAANERALWLETVMEEYSWYFAYSGINRFLYQGRGPEKTLDVDHFHVYGRCLEYYVRTEKLRSVSQKELEQIVVRLALASPV